MADMREYKEVVKAAVARERQADENWSWRIAAITKGAVLIGWGYLDYIGETGYFRVEVLDDDEPVSVVGTLPNGSKTYCFVGPQRWDDCKTIEEAIGITIRNMAATAHNIY